MKNHPQAYFLNAEIKLISTGQQKFFQKLIVRKSYIVDIESFQPITYPSTLEDPNAYTIKLPKVNPHPNTSPSYLNTLPN